MVVGHFSANNGNSTIGLAKWQALGFDVHSTVSAPAALFIDPAHFNYQLKGGRPRSMRVWPLPGDVPADILGVNRPQGVAWDIGCYETSR